MWGIGGGGLTALGGAGADRSDPAEGVIDALNASNSYVSVQGVGRGVGVDTDVDELFCYQVTECVVRPDVNLKRLIATAMRVSEVRHSVTLKHT